MIPASIWDKCGGCRFFALLCCVLTCGVLCDHVCTQMDSNWRDEQREDRREEERKRKERERLAALEVRMKQKVLVYRIFEENVGGALTRDGYGAVTKMVADFL